MSDLNVVGPKAARRAIEASIRCRRPVFLWGPMGIGKSDTVVQIGRDTNRKVIDVRLALWDPVDIRGMPYFDHDSKTMLWAPPAELPKMGNAILFLDELPSAPPAVQAAAYQLILNRRVGMYELPEGVDIVAAGNRNCDKGVTHPMPAPLANRFVHIEMKAVFDDYNEWAILNKQAAQVVGYLNYAKSDLFAFDAKSNSHAFPTPRSWSFVSDFVNDPYIDEGTLTTLVAGTIGDGAAAKFMAHRKIVHLMPKPIDVLTGVVKKLDVTEISAHYSLVTELCYELREQHQKKAKNWNEMFDEFLSFIMNNMTAELVTVGARTALATFQLPVDPSKLKNFDTFHKKYGKFIIAAVANK